MSVAYKAVGWNRQKRIYDLGIAGILLVAFGVYAGATLLLQPLTTAETLIIRFTALAALVLLHLILLIGPLSRFDPRFLPLLYNRRHLGVTMFCLAAVHGIFSIIQFHAGGDVFALVSVLTAYARDYFSFLRDFREVADVPFEVLGLGALTILFLMAATSHDFWLKNLGPSFWKLLHMLVYVAYGLVLAHVLFGAIQSEVSPAFPLLLGLGFCAIVGCHLAAFARERRRDRERAAAASDGFVLAARAQELSPDAGKVVVVNGERIALFLQEGRVFALSNVCRHQGGPLGEGKILNGCVTCPWHGYQYRADDGCSPPPFAEVAPTYPVRVIGDEVHVSGQALPLGTKSEGALLTALPTVAPDETQGAGVFYVGWQKTAPRAIAAFLRLRGGLVLVALCVVFFAAAFFQNPVDVGTFEFGVERTFTGTLYESPLALLQVDPGGAGGGKNFVLVGEGKFGPPPGLTAKNGDRVRLVGSLITRNGAAMIEVHRPESVEVLETSAGPAAPVVALGNGEFVGELVDTKCFFGVMRPATGKVHRGCAARCLSGGVPPGLLVRDGEGNGVVLLLAGEPGKPFKIDSELAARTLAVRGALELHSGTPVLRVASFRLQP